MRFDYNKYFGEEMVLSDADIKLIKSKAKELRKICYGFGFFNFYTMSEYVGDDELTCPQVADKLGEVLPFVKENRKRLIEDEWIERLLNKIEGYIEDIPVSVLDSPLSVEDIFEKMNENFEGYEIADALSKFCDKATACKAYDYLKKQHCDDEDDDED